MPGDAGTRRVLALFETQWDRKQLAACRERWAARIDIEFPEPRDADCPAALDPRAYIERAVRGGLGRIDGVLSSSDYPGAAVAAAIAARLGLSGPRPAAVLEAGHKYYSRVAQRAAVPQSVPAFALLDPRQPEPRPPLGFPFFMKPVKGSYSVLARRIEDRAAFDAFVGSRAVLEFGQDYLAIFNRLVEAYTSFEVDGHWFIAEGLLTGDLVTVEGYAWDRAVEVFGIVDSTLHPNKSFARFDYPSLLPAEVQARMVDIAKRVVARLGLDRCLFNVEMMHDPASGRIWIVEINPRICGQFADLYQKVDGINTYEIALALALGERPQRARGEGAFAAAASFPLRIFESMRVQEAPTSGDVAAAEELFPETLVWSECAAGDTLAVSDVEEDGGSHRYAVINVGGESRKEVQSRCDVVHARLGYRMERQAGAPPRR